MSVPEVEMRECVEERVMELPVSVMLFNNRVADASSLMSVPLNDGVELCLIVKLVSVSCTAEMEKKGEDEHEVMKKVTA